MEKTDLKNLPTSLLNTNPWVTHKNNMAYLFENLFVNSISHDMGVGFFTTGWVRANAYGVARFLVNQGKARWLMSPDFRNKMDQGLLQEYDESSFKKKTSIMEQILAEDVEEVVKLLKDKEGIIPSIKELISSNLLEIKVCVPFQINKGGLFHPKLHFFKDSMSNIVCLAGSGNATRGAQEVNIEMHDLHANFKKNDNHENEPDFVNKREIQPKVEIFLDWWESRKEKMYGYRALVLSKACKEEIIRTMQDQPRKYKAKVGSPPEDQALDFFMEIPKKYYEDKRFDEIQKKALDACKKKNYNLILEMATGTGKTITALKSFYQFFQEDQDKNRPILIITCPGRILLGQWQEVLNECGIKGVISYVESGNKQRSELSSKLTNHSIKPDKNLQAIIFKHEMLGHTKVRNALLKIKNESFFLVDEVHRVMFRESFFDQDLQEFFSKFDKKIGLTATVERRVVNLHTFNLESYIENYFGPDCVVEIVNLYDAIYLHKVLCEYEYHPIFYKLTQSEFDEAVDIYKKIRPYDTTKEDDIRVKRQTKKKTTRDQSGIIFKLTNYINSVPSKTLVLKEHLDDEAIKSLNKCLIFAQNREEVIEISKHLTLKNVSFSYIYGDTTDYEREVLLEKLSDGSIKIILSHTILDEGINLPSVSVAFITASHREPRQAIQRRGRILRIHGGKTMAYIYDMVCQVDESLVMTEDANSGRKFLKWIRQREKERMEEFYKSSSNPNPIVAPM